MVSFLETRVRPASQVDETEALTPPLFRASLIWPIAGLIFPPTGIAALVMALKSRQAQDRKDMLRYATRSRLLAQYSLSIAFAIAVVGFVISALVANDYAVAESYFDPEILGAGFPQIATAFIRNLWVSVVAQILAVIWGLVLAVSRSLPGRAAAPVRFMAVLYIDLFRGLPALLTILIIGFGLPQTGLPFVSNLSLFASGTLALTIVYGAYLAETFRAGIESVHWSQVAAGRAIGLNYFQVMRFVVVPQALRSVIPPLLNWYISLLKDTSLLSVLGLLEGVNTARILVTAQSNLTSLTGVSLCFLAVTIPLARFTDYLIRRNAARLRGAG
ncbi:MAG: amino acid transporter permease [Cypionkella sp.]|uniref:amino acid ABC transporter permease n=1 Tax=Cypionkella sp. TaxID=2811411 RepID=UPI0026106DA7|nr:amino acid ABC transporter permease [Cypionkella sp.]MDB5660825.1 amino acid transporter permease [Cypionkella sp.]